MAIIVKHSEQGADLTPITPVEDGVYTGLCIGVFDVGLQKNVRFDKISRKVFLFFEIDEKIKEDGAFKDKRYVVHKEFTLSFHPKSNLRKTIDLWVGPVADEDGVVEFDLENLLGQSGLLTLNNTTGSNGRVYTNIMHIGRLPKGTKVFKMENLDYQAPKFVQHIASQQLQKEDTSQVEV